MNKNIKLAVASAVLALSASANAGIIIPAGDWTVDINGNVNAYATSTRAKDAEACTAGGATFGCLANTKVGGEKDYNAIGTGLLPAWLGVTGTTRQNDTDVSFNISMQPNVSDNAISGDSKTPLFRTAYLSFGDKSWGTIKLGKDIGIFGSQAILNDMTLLGVGAQVTALSGTSTTLGGIGTGYIYAAWKGQATYTTPNFNGFQVSLGLTNPNQGLGSTGVTDSTATLAQDRFGMEGQASYTFSADAISGKVWMSGATYKVKPAAAIEYTADVVDVGANFNAGNAGITGYYYKGEGVGTTMMHNAAASVTGNKRDSDGGYLQATYVLPSKTKLGLAYGVSKLDLATGESLTSLVKENKRITLGAYHPLTKHLNLVGELNQIESESQLGRKNTSDSVSLGAILFF